METVGTPIRDVQSMKNRHSLCRFFAIYILHSHPGVLPAAIAPLDNLVIDAYSI